MTANWLLRLLTRSRSSPASFSTDLPPGKARPSPPPLVFTPFLSPSTLPDYNIQKRCLPRTTPTTQSSRASAASLLRRRRWGHCEQRPGTKCGRPVSPLSWYVLLLLSFLPHLQTAAFGLRVCKWHSRTALRESPSSVAFLPSPPPHCKDFPRAALLPWTPTLLPQIQFRHAHQLAADARAANPLLLSPPSTVVLKMETLRRAALLAAQALPSIPAGLDDPVYLVRPLPAPPPQLPLFLPSLASSRAQSPAPHQQQQPQGSTFSPVTPRPQQQQQQQPSPREPSTPTRQATDELRFSLSPEFSSRRNASSSTQAQAQAQATPTRPTSVDLVEAELSVPALEPQQQQQKQTPAPILPSSTPQDQPQQQHQQQQQQPLLPQEQQQQQHTVPASSQATPQGNAQAQAQQRPVLAPPATIQVCLFVFPLPVVLSTYLPLLFTTAPTPCPCDHGDEPLAGGLCCRLRRQAPPPRPLLRV